jgi:hypothetical protein
MRPSLWRPPVELSYTEQAIINRIKRAGLLYCKAWPVRAGKRFSKNVPGQLGLTRHTVHKYRSRVSFNNPRFRVAAHDLPVGFVSAILTRVGRDASAVGRNTREGAHSYAHDPSSHSILARGSEPL